MANLKASLFVAFTQMLILGSVFFRNVIIARLLTPYDMAVASVLSLVVTALEQATNVGLQSYVVKSIDEDLERVMACSHFIAVVRGFFLSIVLLISSGLLSRLFSFPNAVNAFLAISIIPFLNGFLNLDIFLHQRKMKFGPSAYSELVGGIVSIVFVIVGVFVFADYRACALGLVMQALAATLTSHLMSMKRYCVSAFKSEFYKISRFGLPLMLNGILLTTTINGDRFILATSEWINAESPIGVEEFASYSLCYSLLFTLAMGATRISNNLILPTIASMRDDNERLRKTIGLFSEALFFVSTCIILVFAIFGRDIISWVYGPTYLMDAGLVTTLAVGLACRSMRTLPTAISICENKTHQVLFASVIRACAIPVIAVCVYVGWGFLETAIVLLVAEELCLIYAWFAALTTINVTWRVWGYSIFGHWIISAICLSLAFSEVLFGSVWGRVLLLACLLCVVSLFLTECRGYIETSWRTSRFYLLRQK
jgi:O-antigen/teichoic acid export membrane protein